MGFIKVFLLTVLVFGVLIFVHELGHFIAARAFKVKVNEFAIGMGPAIFSHKSKKSGTLYSLRLLPIGGYNSMEGENEASEDDGAFCSKPAWQRMIIVVSGGLMNLLLGILLMFIIVLCMEKYPSTYIHSFYDYEAESYVEEFCGLKSGDRIVKIDGKRVHIGDEVSYAIFSYGVEPISVTVVRDGKTVTVENVSFPVGESEGITYGVRNIVYYAEKKNFTNTVKQVFYGSTNSMTQIIDSLKGMLTGKYGFNEISGPIGVGDALGEAASMGIESLLMLTVLLAMNLGIFNLLPFPALDGGRLVFLIIEAVRRKPISRNIESAVHSVGMLLLLGLVFVVAFKDVFMVIKR